MTLALSRTPDFEKMPDGLVPAIIQDAHTAAVLMLGYMNAESLQKTQETGLVTFFSRSKQRLWTKGEESGHVLRAQNILLDCDDDTLLIQATMSRAIFCINWKILFGNEKMLLRRHPTRRSYLPAVLPKLPKKWAKKQ